MIVYLLILNLIHLSLVVGSLTWNEKKNASKPTAATLTKAWDGETSSTNVVNKVGEPVQPKPNAGIYIYPITRLQNY